MHCLINNAAQTVRRAAAATARAPPECLASLYWLAQLTRDRGWYVRMASLEQTAFESVSPCAQARNKCTPKRIPEPTHKSPLRLRASAAATTARTRRLRSLRAFRCAQLDRFRCAVS